MKIKFGIKINFLKIKVTDQLMDYKNRGLKCIFQINSKNKKNKTNRFKTQNQPKKIFLSSKHLFHVLSRSKDI
jgi:hypothetical protein